MPAAVLQTLTMKAVTTFYRRLLVSRRTLLDLPPYTPPEHIQVRFLTTNDADAYGKLQPRERRSKYLHRLEMGHHCVAAFYDDYLAHVGWVATGPCELPYFHCTLVPPPATIYRYGNFTAPAWRKRGLTRACTEVTWRHFAGLGYTAGTGLIAPENSAGLTTYTRLGATIIGLLGCWRLGPLRRYWQQNWSHLPMPTIVTGRPGLQR